MSTPTEKTTICHSFLKPAKKKATQTCNTAGFLSPRFSGRAKVGVRGKTGVIAKIHPGKKIARFAFFWQIQGRTGKTAWQKYLRFQGRYGPISGIEIGRILANRAQTGRFFRANPNGAF